MQILSAEFNVLMLLFQKKGRKFGTMKMFNPAANVLSQESVVVVCFCNLYVFLVSRSFILYRLDRWFSRLNGFTLVIFGALYSLLFGVSQCSVLKAIP